jgi:hypothetical protein
MSSTYTFPTQRKGKPTSDYLWQGVLLLALLLGFGLATPATASTDTTSTVVNFDTSGNQLTRYDVLGNAVDAHDGEIHQFGNTYYLYGTSYNCGYTWQTKGAPFCGFKSYSSTDLIHWTDNGLLFGISDPSWQTNCGGSSNGCFRPHVLYNSKYGKYVLWINDYSASANYRVFESTSPTGPFTQVGVPSLAVNNSCAGKICNGDENLFLDTEPSGAAYIAYTNRASPNGLIIEQLNDSYESGTGNHKIAISGSYEAPVMFMRNNTYYLVFGPLCAYCGGTATMVVSASSPLGIYSKAASINSNSCGGQPTHVASIVTSSGTMYMFMSDLWHSGFRNEALANYFWGPLGFNADNTIESFSCVPSFSATLSGGVAGSQQPPANLDQWDGVAGFRAWCDINPYQRLQTFTPANTGTLTSVSLTTFQGGSSSGVYPNADLILDIVNISGGKPAGVITSTTVSRNNVVGYSPRRITIEPNITVDGGQLYGILAHTTATQGCYGWAFNTTD